MPKGGKFPAGTRVNFITNYFLQGCVPPFWLFIECAREPAANLLLLLILPDLADIAQVALGPKGGRKRRPGRHGRKSGRGVSFPDSSDMVGAKVRGVINPHDAFDFGPTRKAFRIFNVYEGVAFSAAVLEGVTDTAYLGILGVLSLHPEHCPQMGFIQRHSINQPVILGVAGPNQSLNVNEVDAVANFTSTSPFQTISFHGDYTLSLAGMIYDPVGLGVKGLNIKLINQDGEVKAETGVLEYDPGYRHTVAISGEFKSGDLAKWVADCTFGYAQFERCDILGFTGTFA